MWFVEVNVKQSSFSLNDHKKETQYLVAISIIHNTSQNVRDCQDLIILIHQEFGAENWTVGGKAINVIYSAIFQPLINHRTDQFSL